MDSLLIVSPEVWKACRDYHRLRLRWCTKVWATETAQPACWRHQRVDIGGVHLSDLMLDLSILMVGLSILMVGLTILILDLSISIIHYIYNQFQWLIYQFQRLV